MTQIKKQNIQDSIDAAARKLFASKGYKDTKIGDIAREAGISVGNLYRYETGKESLFERLYPAAIADDFLLRIREKMQHYFNTNDQNLHQDDAAAFHQFIIDQEQTFLILVKKSEASIHQGFAERLADQLAIELKRHLPGAEDIPVLEVAWLDHMLKTIYLSLFRLYLSVLEENQTVESKLKGLTAANVYHVSGMLKLINLVKEKVI